MELIDADASFARLPDDASFHRSHHAANLLLDLIRRDLESALGDEWGADAFFTHSDR